MEGKIEKFDYTKFPGANPKSFNEDYMFKLQQCETIVCEKSDGVRYFLCECVTKAQTYWLLIDRNYTFRQASPSFDMAEIHKEQYQGRGENNVIRNLFDGELLQDNDWRGGLTEPVFLVFDALVVNRKSQLALPFDVRLLTADAYIESRISMMRMLVKKGYVRHGSIELPKIDIFMKEMFSVWDAKVIFDKILNKLQHENDGLIFTVKACPYYPGTCEHIFKWKPMHLNTIDFNVLPLPKRVPCFETVWQL